MHGSIQPHGTHWIWWAKGHWTWIWIFRVAVGRRSRQGGTGSWGRVGGDPDPLNLYALLESSDAKWNIISYQHGVYLGFHFFLAGFGGSVSAHHPPVVHEGTKGIHKHNRLGDVSIVVPVWLYVDDSSRSA